MPNLRARSRITVAFATLLGVAAGVGFVVSGTAAAPMHAQAEASPPVSSPAEALAQAPSPSARAVPRPPGGHPATPTAAADLCKGPGESYGITDFPCPQATVQSWWSGGSRNGRRTREHAWYLFAGLNRVTGDRPLWRTWPTSSQVFPGQFGAGGSSHHDLASLPGGLLEHPAPGTPRLAGASLPPNVDPGKLELAGGPQYQVPDRVLANPRYKSCIRQRADGPHLIDGPSFQNNGDVMIAAVVFSPNAAKAVADNRLWDAGILDNKVPASGGMAPPGAVNLPMNSLSLKIMFWPVRGDGDGFTPLPQWDNLLPDANRITVQRGHLKSVCEVYAGFENQKLWQRAVALNAGPGVPPPSVTASYLGSVPLAGPFTFNCTPVSHEAVPITYTQAPTVSLHRFYTVSFTDQQLAAMDPCDEALLDQSAYWSYGRAFDSRDKLAMIAMHVMTKEQDTWTFQSAWWYDGAFDCTKVKDARAKEQCNRYTKDRPNAQQLQPGPWQNYLITTTYGLTQQDDYPNQWPRPFPNPNATYWPVAYNPYIELAVGHPIDTTV